MKRISFQTLLSVGVIGAAGMLAACSSSSNSPGSGGSGGSGGTSNSGGSAGTTSGNSGGSGNGSCNGNIHVFFSPMYSGYDGGGHMFQIPATGFTFDSSGNSTLVTNAMWTASDTTKVSLAAWTDTTNTPPLQGTMITTMGSGTVTITATSGSDCGQSTLNIANYDPSLFDVGKARYNLTQDQEMPPKRLACIDCHGPTATNGQFKTVSHTPEQTGGFSDDDLKNIFEHAMFPPNGYYDNSVYPMSEWMQFHQWDMQGNEADGIVVYLRALAPIGQHGGENFGMGGGADAGSGTSSSDAASE
jgi:hypothetical protein